MKFLEAILVLVGMIVGVGMFGIPFSFSQSGFLVGAVELIILTVVTIFLHLYFADIIIATPEAHRLPGYVRKYLGKQCGFFAYVIGIVGTVGTLLAYVVIGGIFLKNLYFPGSYITAIVMFALTGSVISNFSLKKEVGITSVLTFLLIIFIVSMSLFLLPTVDIANLSTIHFSNFFFPYGVLLFALSGGVAVPSVVALLSKNRKAITKAVIIGTTIPAILYFLFAFSIVGIAGNGVSPEALSGIQDRVYVPLFLLGNLIGLLAVFTAFIILHSYFQDLLTLDVGISHSSSWVVATIMPLLGFYLGFQNFIIIINILGAFLGGIEAGFIIAIHTKIHRIKLALSIASLWNLLLYSLFIVGVSFELYAIFM